MASLSSGMLVGDKYRVDKHVAEGGMSQVWAGTHVVTGKAVALKVLRADATQATRERMLREARAACAVQHPNVVLVHDVLATDDGSPVLVMDLLRGETLRERLVRRKSLSLGETVAVLLPTLSAVGAAHALGIVHRDLKPENIFLSEEGGQVIVKVLDFGIAKLLSDGVDTGGALTKTGALLGTPHYMAPEQILGEKIDPRADIWALGVILYECLSGVRPAEEDAVGKVLKRVLTNTLVPLRDAVDGIPEEVLSLVDTMLREAPDERPRDVAQVVEALSAYAPVSSLRSVGSGPISLPSSDRAAELPETPDAPLGGRPARPEELAPTLMAPAPAGATAAPTKEAARRRSTGRRGVFVIGSLIAITGGAAALFWLKNPGSQRADYVPATPGIGSQAAQRPTAKGACPPEMALIEGGRFRMGSEDGRDDERPAHEVLVAPFCLDLREVSAGAYSACAQKGACRPPESSVKWHEMSQALRDRESASCIAYNSDKADYPINCVSWGDAERYCRAVDKRLPSETEWEYAAAGGGEQRPYAWGSAPPGPTRTNACDPSCIALGIAEGAKEPVFAGDDGHARLAPVDAFAEGKSRFGPLNLTGNVWEWTSSRYCPYPDHECEGGETDAGAQGARLRVFRGGGWGTVLGANLRVTTRMWGNAENRMNDVGFRCARSAD